MSRSGQAANMPRAAKIAAISMVHARWPIMHLLTSIKPRRDTTSSCTCRVRSLAKAGSKHWLRHIDRLGLRAEHVSRFHGIVLRRMSIVAANVAAAMTSTCGLTRARCESFFRPAVLIVLLHCCAGDHHTHCRYQDAGNFAPIRHGLATLLRWQFVRISRGHELSPRRSPPQKTAAIVAGQLAATRRIRPKLRSPRLEVFEAKIRQNLPKMTLIRAVRLAICVGLANRSRGADKGNCHCWPANAVPRVRTRGCCLYRPDGIVSGNRRCKSAAAAALETAFR